jgi:hypothetical protein
MFLTARLGSLEDFSTMICIGVEKKTVRCLADSDDRQIVGF